MSELAVTGAVVVAGALLVFVWQRAFRSDERPLLWAGFALHLAASAAQILIITLVYGRGDMLGYYRSGVELAELMTLRFDAVAPEVLKLLLQQDASLPIHVYGAGGHAGSVMAMSAWLCFLLGSSLWAINAVIATFAFAGKALVYRVLRGVFSRRYHRRLMIVCLLVPSSVFWTSALLKEGFAGTGLSLMIVGCYLAIHTRRRALGVAVCALGYVPIAVTKPYFLFPLTFAAGALAFSVAAARRGRRIRLLDHPVRATAAAFAVAVATLGLGTLFPRFALENVTESAAVLVEYGATSPSNSAYFMASGGGPIQQLLSAPMGLATALYRPFIFEAHNPLSLVAALESSTFLVLTLIILRRRGIRGTWRVITSSPTLLFLTVFVLSFGTAVGVTSMNFGTLSRYRAPMVPLFGALLVLLLPLRRRQSASRRLPPRRPVASSPGAPALAGSPLHATAQRSVHREVSALPPSTSSGVTRRRESTH